MSVYLRSLLWTILCPGTVTLLLPCWLLSAPGWPDQPWTWRQWAGLAPVVAGGSVLFWCIYSFARHGKGTLSPVDPARRLVVSGLYRYVRNPMYVGIMAVLLGEARLFGSLILLGYAGLVFLIFNLFVRLYEEPYLRKQFGDEYARYCERVERWWPRFTDHTPVP